MNGCGSSPIELIKLFSILEIIIKMSKTPIKTVENMQQFIPKDVTSPNKDSNGLAKTVFIHVSSVHSLLNNWVKLIDKGTKITKAISALRIHECYDDYYPEQLKKLTEGLIEIMDSLKVIISDTKILKDQLLSLSKLQPSSEPVINTWSVLHISSEVSKLYQSLEKEYKLKEVITENIAHCRDEKLIEVYASAWEFDIYVSMDSTSYLFVEMGLSNIL